MELHLSTVLWANLLVDGAVQSEQEDHHALYKYADKLDALTKDLNLPLFRSICDSTDVRFNTDALEPPPAWYPPTK